MNEYQENLAVKGRLGSGNLANSLVLIAEDEANKSVKDEPQFKTYPIDIHKWSDIDQAHAFPHTGEIQIIVGGGEGYINKFDATAIAKHFNLIGVDND